MMALYPRSVLALRVYLRALFDVCLIAVTP
jgi:hypothetical protein